MAQDIVPELNKAIETSFRSRMSRDSRVRAITKRMDTGTATLADMHDYSVRVGENLSGALRSNITADILPNETLYYNIADRTVRPALQTGYDLINDAAAATQKAIDASNGIGINSVRAPFPSGRVDGLIDMMSAQDITIENALKWLEEPIVNNVESFLDDFIRENVNTSARIGLKATIRRSASAAACGWCADLEGTYEYGEEPEDIYRRHEFCKCVVTFSRERGKFQDVWSKKEYNSERDARIARAEAVENEKKQNEALKTETRRRIQSGEYSLRLSRQKYTEHVKDTAEYINTTKMRNGLEPSQLTISYQQAQTLINTYSGLGDPATYKDGTLSVSEYASAPFYVGKVKVNGEWIKTRRFKIIHGKGGSHIVPAEPRYKGRYRA